MRAFAYILALVSILVGDVFVSIGVWSSASGLWMFAALVMVEDLIRAIRESKGK